MNRKYLSPLLLLLQLLLLKIISFFPKIVEQWYSNGLYPILSQTLRFVFGKIPFSVGDLFYFMLILLGIRWFWRKRKSWKLNWKNNSWKLLHFVSVLYFTFHLLWGLNYYREPLFEKMNIERDYSDTDLLVFTKKLIAKTNAIQLQITANKNAKVILPYSQEQVFQINLDGYATMTAEHTFFNYSELSVKKSLFSLPLSYMGFGGYLNPFTNEAQLNYLMPIYQLPTTSCHEMAHQMGYASESECNFIGVLASIKNKNSYSQYSGYSFALRYCLVNWQMRNEQTYTQLLQTVHPGILKNYQENDTFWKAYETPIETGFHRFYDAFLKWNQQAEGIESYSKFVNLMVNYYKNKALL